MDVLEAYVVRKEMTDGGETSAEKIGDLVGDFFASLRSLLSYPKGRAFVARSPRQSGVLLNDATPGEMQFRTVHTAQVIE